ncbi:hypothetical protein POV27_06570 [Aureisphaera galaxeae]|uniref:hypothetical protein n=1 Tax=Aureisphaera galaxeae TaxID=1538023 RepID=UPI00234FFD9D|nr:hypothetical protein [Aureisphaera galaxeae]MDC8003707.1 hypothetical protein [Aureisphaera galaxeae]
MRYLFLCFALLFCNLSFSQHTPHFLERTQSIQPSDTSLVQRHYKNGVIKEEGKNLAYKMPEYTYFRKYGLYKTYYKDGILKSEVTYDRFGNPLTSIFYNRDGTTWWKSKTLEIDLAIEDPSLYFLTRTPVSVTKWDKELKYGQGIAAMFIKTEGKLVDGRKVGVWKVYDELGRLEGEVNYDNR